VPNDAPRLRISGRISGNNTTIYLDDRPLNYCHGLTLILEAGKVNRAIFDMRIGALEVDVTVAELLARAIPVPPEGAYTVIGNTYVQYAEPEGVWTKEQWEEATARLREQLGPVSESSERADAGEAVDG
jgi:hypothetical protein